MQISLSDLNFIECQKCESEDIRVCGFCNKVFCANCIDKCCVRSRCIDCNSYSIYKCVECKNPICKQHSRDTRHCKNCLLKCVKCGNFILRRTSLNDFCNSCEKYTN